MTAPEPPTTAATPRRITDPETLKGLSHPLRQRLLRLLTQLGPSTTTILAEHLDGADPGRISYHLRELGKRGFIEEAPELARDRRERWWRVPQGAVVWSNTDFRTPEGRIVAEAAYAQQVEDQFERLRTHAVAREGWSADWQEAATSSNSNLRLRPDELRALCEELNAVIRRWSEPGRRDPSLRPEQQPVDGREHVFLFFHAFPERP
ncbi:helix-turn-helix domain-containing protein [Catenulispora yoronensis]|uniref:Helix-turn-helix domain-containing protein n=1 Tax=Catenulispora yoronensis TaxID=450799 RepID=A0ABP5FBY8_9ACTN